MSGVSNHKRKPSGAKFRNLAKQKKQKIKDCVSSCMKLNNYFEVKPVKVCNSEI